MSEEARQARGSFHVGAALAGVIFVALGALFMLDALDVATIRRDVVLPVVLMALGLAVIASSLWRSRRAD